MRDRVLIRHTHDLYLWFCAPIDLSNMMIDGFFTLQSARVIEELEFKKLCFTTNVILLSSSAIPAPSYRLSKAHFFQRSMVYQAA